MNLLAFKKNLSWVEAYSTPMMEEDLFLLARQPVKKSVPSAMRSSHRSHPSIPRLRELCSSKVACLSWPGDIGQQH